MNIIISVLAMLILLETPLYAEGFLDVYAGTSFSNRASLTITSNVASRGDDVSLSGEATYGIRGGYWLGKLPWLGFGGDVSALHAHGANAKFDIVPITPLALFRIPLVKDEEVPQGHFQPYIGIGPSVSLYTHANADLGAPTNGISGSSTIGSAVGFQLPVGMSLQLSRHVALFSEYRFAFYKVDVDQNFISQVFASNNVARNLKADLSMHNILAGISFRF